MPGSFHEALPSLSFAEDDFCLTDQRNCVADYGIILKVNVCGSQVITTSSRDAGVHQSHIESSPANPFCCL